MTEEEIKKAKEKNEKKYNELVMRVNEIRSVYPDPYIGMAPYNYELSKTVPAEIKREYSLLGDLCGYLDYNAAVGGPRNMQITDDGYYIHEWRKPGFLDDLEKLNDFYEKYGKKELNPSSAVLQPINFEELKSRILMCKNHDELRQLDQKEIANAITSCSFSDSQKYSSKLVDAVSTKRAELNKIKEKEDREQKIKEREQLEKQIFENQKKAYNDLNPLKKAWYKITNKAVKVDGTWIVDEPVELSEENARSIR